MKRYSEKTIRSLKLDRKNGMSMPNLVDKYKMPKTSIWHHVKNVSMSDEKFQLISSRRGGSRARKEDGLRRAQKEAGAMLHTMNFKKMGILLFIALYWAEGNKGSFIFTNTDASMIRIFIRLVKEYFNVKNDDLTALIRITDHLDTKECFSYWRRATQLPAKNIFLNINNKQNKTKTKHGICRLVLKKGGYKLKLTNALINEVVRAYLPPRSSMDRTRGS